MATPQSVVAKKPVSSSKVPQKAGAPARSVDPKKAARDAFAAGKASLAELEGVGPKQLEANAALAQRLLAHGQLEPALKIFTGLVALEPREAHFHLGCGAVVMQQGDWATAEKWFTRALERNPNMGAAAAYRGEVRLHRGNVKGAVADLQAALKAEPACRQPHTLRARSLLLALLQRSRQPAKAPSSKGRIQQVTAG